MSASRSALIVASERYSDPKLSRLRAPTHDAEALAEILADEKVGQFDVNVLVDQSEVTVRRRIDAFFQDRSTDDLLLLHFSCHGVKDDEGNLYFAMPDTDMGALDSTAVSAEFVERQIRRSRSRRVVLLLDCCYSGAFARGSRARAGDAVDLRERFEGRGRAVITASSSMEYAFEGDELSGAGSPSVFTEALVQGLRTGEADRDEDGLISIDELYDHVYEEVRERTPKQTPGKWSDVEGRLIIARSLRPIVVKPVALPGDLHSLIESHIAGVREGAVYELSRLAKGRDAGLALSARRGLEHLVEDDSRRVSGLAAAALEELGPLEEPAPHESLGPIATMLPERTPEPPVQAPRVEAFAAAPAVAVEPVAEATPAVPAAAAPVAEERASAERTLGAPAALALLGVALYVLSVAVASARGMEPWDSLRSIWLVFEVWVVPAFLIGALVAVMRTGRRGFAQGLVLGFATQFVSISLIDIVNGVEPRGYAVARLVGAVTALAAAVAVDRRLATEDEEAPFSRRRLSAALMLPAGLLIAASPFVDVLVDTSIYRLDRPLIIPLLTAAVGLLAMSGALLALPARTRTWGGIASALGFATLAYLLSFVAFPLLLPDDELGTWALLGLIGAVLAVVAGIAALDVSEGLRQIRESLEPIMRPVVVSAAGVVVALVALLVAGTRSSFPHTALESWFGKSWMWELFQYLAIPALMLLALAGAAAVRDRRGFFLGAVTGFGTVSVAAYVALIAAKGSLVVDEVASDAGGASTPPALHAVVPALGMAVATVFACVAFARLARTASPDELSLSRPRPWVAAVGAVGVAAMAMAFFATTFSEDVGNNWVHVLPIAAIALVGIACAGLFRFHGREQFWAGIMLAAAVQALAFFVPFLVLEPIQNGDLQLDGDAFLGIGAAAAVIAAVLALLRSPTTSTAEAGPSLPAPA